MAKVPRYTDSELELIKKTFAENESALKLIRKVMLQIPLKEEEEKSRLAIFVPAVMHVVRKSILPEIDVEAPINQVIDLWATVRIDDKHPEQAMLFIEARKLLIEYLEQQLTTLATGKVNNQIVFNSFTNIENKTADEIFIELLTRNNLLAHIEFQLGELNVLAGMKNETPEETMERLQANSTK